MENFLGELRVFAGNFAPVGWALCNGQQMSISNNESLFTLIGTTYGGDGITTFNLPNLMGRVAVNAGADRTGNPYQIGQVGGTPTVTLTATTMPAHTHNFNVSNTPGNNISPNGTFLA